MRTVRQVCIDEGHNFPSAKGALESALYMDDFAYSISDEDAAAETAKEVIQLLKAGQFDLVKWNNCHPTLEEGKYDFFFLVLRRNTIFQSELKSAQTFQR
ncbi:unnamed protein product [Callosobruchus maculatus]|uniref:Uncharacterized protein n=1 Tax=Callosobruchus maculatus TaxID=64391 RepID=A0A653BIK1_CALMS|nr:unnamed protein product [Callosobruchus maculatus]